MSLALVLDIAASVVSLYVALLSRRFSRAPGWEDQRFFGFVALTASGYTFFDAFSSLALPAASTVAASRFQLCFAGLHLAGWVRFSAAFLGREPGRLDRLLIGLGVIAGTASLVPGALFSGLVSSHEFAPLGIRYYDSQPTGFGSACLAAYCLVLVVVLVRFSRAWYAGRLTAAPNAIGVAVLLLTATSDSLVTTGLIDLPYLLGLGFFVPVATGGYLLTKRFVESARALDVLSARLEQTVSERTQTLSRTQDALHRAEKLGALGQLAAGVAHEINNPAAAVAANLRYLLEASEDEGRFPDDAGDCLEESQRSMDRIARVVRQLLDAGRLAAASNVETTSVDLRDAVEEAVRLARSRLGERVSFVDSVPEGLYAIGHEQALVQVLVNLVVNAGQAIGEERTGGRIVISSERRGDTVELVVQDNGSGMAEETLRRLFEPFFSTKGFGKGTGLGLAVSRGLLAGLGGDLRLESTLGEGTRAIVHLRAALTVPEEVAAGSPRAEPPGPRRRLLLVDDDADVRDALRRCLASRYQVTLADGAEEALSLLAHDWSFDIVLCDLMMPDGGGARVYEVLRATTPALASRLVFLTGGATTAEARDFLSAQKQPVLHKPLDLAALASVADELARGGEAPGAPPHAL